MRERRNNITDADVVQVLKEGSDKARSEAAEKIHEVRKRVGIAI
jgi:hypothetical protein